MRIATSYPWKIIVIIIWGSLALTNIALAQSPDNDAPPDFFIEAEVDNLTPYVGQQITYNVRRYQAVEFPNPPHYEEHLFAGFWNTPLIQRPSYTTTIAGREYLVHPTHIALFSNTSGPITIAPAKLIIPGDGPEADIILESEPINLQVQLLPEGAPRNFRGAVGQFEISSKFNVSEGRVNETLNLIVEIKGNDNIQTLLEPTLIELEHWTLMDMFGSQVTSNVPLSKEVVKGLRRFEWTTMPLQAGEQFYPAIRFSYFDPETETYRTIRTDPIPITILPKENDSVFTSPIVNYPQPIKRLTGDIRHIKPVPTSLAKSIGATRIIRQLLYWSCLILPLLAIGGAWFWHSWQQRHLADTPQARRHRARYRARKILTTAHRPEADSYVVIRHAIAGYLSDKLNQPIAGLTSDQLLDLLNKVQLNPQLTERIYALLGQVDAGRFAPIADEQATTRSLVAIARILIDDLEKFFSKRGL